MQKQLAQTLKLPWNNADVNISGPEDFAFSDIGSIIAKALNEYIFFFAGAGLLIVLISAGYTYLTSAGDPKKMDSAQQKITHALIGIIIIIAAYWVVQIAGRILGIEEINNIFNSGGGSKPLPGPVTTM